jgi:hypothetical protein
MMQTKNKTQGGAMNYATTLVPHLYIGENNGSSDLPGVGPLDPLDTGYYRAGANNSDLTVGNKVTLNNDFAEGILSRRERPSRRDAPQLTDGLLGTE